MSREAELLLSPEARQCGFREGGYLWFEEDCCEQVVLRELMDKKFWTPPADRIKDPVEFENAINRSIKEYHPDYWKAREKRLAKPPQAAEKKPATRHRAR